MNDPRVAIISLWRNDEHRHIAARIDRMLRKSYRNRRYVWLVADSTDATFDILVAAAMAARHEFGVHVHVSRQDTGIEVVGEVAGAVNADRLRRLSRSISDAFRLLTPDDDYAIIHESDLISPDSVVEMFLANVKCARSPIAGWPILSHPTSGVLFYDTWGYRHVDGRQFTNHEPRPESPFRVDSFGSVAMFPASDLRGMEVEVEAFREICANLRKEGARLWCDPAITVVQPTELWP